MSNPTENNSETGSLLKNLLIFLVIFTVLIISILALHFSGVLNALEPPSTTSAESIQTLPPLTTQTTPPPTTATPTTEAPTTAQTTPTPITQVTTTKEIVTYPPATVPTYITTAPATTPPTTITTPPVTTTASTPQQPPVVGAYDISDEAMEALIDVRYLSIHDDSRSGYKLWSVKNIVVHYVANPGSTADQNWRNFENNKPGTSAHFIIGLDGEIIQCMPLDEVAWAIGTKEGNYTSISIECCHPDDTGKFTDATYESLVRLVSWLCKKFDLGRDEVIRHYDYPRYTASGYEWHKECPLYYADANDPESHKRWEKFKEDLIIE